MVRFNIVCGYYLEISKANMHLAPADYERKQTLVNAERFTTPGIEGTRGEVILEAEEKILTLEREIFETLRVMACTHAASNQEHGCCGCGVGCYCRAGGGGGGEPVCPAAVFGIGRDAGGGRGGIR